MSGYTLDDWLDDCAGDSGICPEHGYRDHIDGLKYYRECPTCSNVAVCTTCRQPFSAKKADECPLCNAAKNLNNLLKGLKPAGFDLQNLKLEEVDYKRPEAMSFPVIEEQKLYRPDSQWAEPEYGFSICPEHFEYYYDEDGCPICNDEAEERRGRAMQESTGHKVNCSRCGTEYWSEDWCKVCAAEEEAANTDEDGTDQDEDMQEVKIEGKFCSMCNQLHLKGDICPYLLEGLDDDFGDFDDSDPLDYSPNIWDYD